MRELQQKWNLKRRDDNGNQYVIASYDSEDEARKAMEEYERKKHKQTYWIEKADTQSES